MTDLQEFPELAVLSDTLGEEYRSDHLTLRERIEFRAYRLFEERGRIPGFDLDDWLRAERDVLLEEGIH